MLVLMSAITAMSDAARGAGDSDGAVQAAVAWVVACRRGEPALLGVFEADAGEIAFSLPGGGARAGEDAADTAERETLEETGYRIRAEDGVSIGATDEGLHVMRARVVEQLRRRPASPEIIAAAWVDPARIPARGWRFERDHHWVPRLFEQRAPDDCG